MTKLRTEASYLSKTHYDVIGIGFGPANIALAIALEELHPDIDAVFLEARARSDWQPGMLLAHSDIQNHPLRDLVTPRNPRSRYTFTNFLFENGRLFEHLNLGMLFPMRTEYAQYIAWVAQHFEHSVRYRACAEAVELADDTGADAYPYRVRCTDGVELRARALVAAPGRTPYRPAVFERVDSERIVHLVDYLPALQRFVQPGVPARVAVVGGSQSAVEILLHLSGNYPHLDVAGFTRTYGYRLKDTSPFTGEVYFPEFVDLFFAADRATKKRLRGDLHFTNYSATDADVLDQLYRTIYHQKLVGRQRTTIYRSADIKSVMAADGRIGLTFQRVERPQAEHEWFDLVILATGFRDIGTGEQQERCPPLLNGLRASLCLDDGGCVQIGYDYRAALNGTVTERHPCFVNGLCESSHGMGDAGSFSLLALRAQTIADTLRRCLDTSGALDPPAAVAYHGSVQHA